MITKTVLDDGRGRFEKALTHLRDQLKKIRTGRASAAPVEGMRVDYYGTQTPISQMAQISIPEPRQILIKPFDVSMLKELMKVVSQGDLGAAPQNDGKVLRITLPPLSGEQRQKFSAKVKLQQVIANVYVDHVWARVEHYHSECYETAGQPYGSAA